MPIRVTVFGAGGRMGHAVVQALLAENDIEIAHAVESPDRAGGMVEGVPLVPDADDRTWESDVWVDVSLAAGAMKHARLADRHGIPILIGATGFNDEQRASLEKLGTAHIVAPNLSVGINLLFGLAPKIREILGDGFDTAVAETHHRHKLDAPSGTAARIAELLNAVGPEVQVTSLRIGEVVGEHRVVFAAEGEEIEIVHRAQSRMAFARGVAPAVRFLAGKTSGRYDMQDVLGLSDGANRS